jgi:uncharacterized repeat protein (TIGR03837 family)
MHIDIFCTVIDNHGDLGVCWRLSQQLAERGASVRLFIDQSADMAWLAPAQADKTLNIVLKPWPEPAADSPWEGLGHEPRVDAVISAFGCVLPASYLQAMQAMHAMKPMKPIKPIKPIKPNVKPPVWVNLEYFSAESFSRRCHGLPSPVLQGPGEGLTQWFFYPGLIEGTGGLLRPLKMPEPLTKQDRTAFLKPFGLGDWPGQISLLFCYEPEPLVAWLAALLGEFERTEWAQQSEQEQESEAPEALALIVPAGRAHEAVAQAFAQLGHVLPQVGTYFVHPQLRVQCLPWIPQTVFDQWLRVSDAHAVRGEDSLVQALWTAQPVLWQIYPQEDGAHEAKLEAFLDELLMGAPESLAQTVRRIHRAWNGFLPAASIEGGTLWWGNSLAARMLREQWRMWMQARRATWLMQPDLVTQLVAFIHAH